VKSLTALEGDFKEMQDQYRPIEHNCYGEVQSRSGKSTFVVNPCICNSLGSFGVGEEAFDAGCLQPLDAIFSPEVLAESQGTVSAPPSIGTALQASIGLCLSMRRRKSRQIGRILLSCSAPVTWDEAVTLSRSSSGGLETAMSCDIRVVSELTVCRA
jgi:hypothetical protein